MADNIGSTVLDSPFLSTDSIMALELDTKNRINSVNSIGQAPPTYVVPTGGAQIYSNPSQSQLLSNTQTKGSLYAALNSPDRNIRNSAAQYIRYKNSSVNPAQYGIGVTKITQYDPAMDKYINGKFGYSASLGIKGNEEKYYRDYLSQNIFSRGLSNVGVFLGRLATGIAAKTVATFGYAGSMIKNGIDEMIDPSGNNAMADIADNSLSRWAEVNWEENWKNSSLLSVFKPSDWEQKGFLSKLGNAAFWTDEVADGAAFMGEMVLSTYLTGGLGRIAGLGKLGATGINTASKLSKLPGIAGRAAGAAGKGIDWTLKFATGADDIAGMGRWAFLTTSESAVESSQKYRTAKEEMYMKRDQGHPDFANMSDFQIESEASNIAAHTFRGNMAILSVSNAFENRLIFNKIFKSKRPDAADKAFFGSAVAGEMAVEGAQKGAKKITNAADIARVSAKESKYSNKLGKYFNWKSGLSRSRFYGWMGIKAFGMEGLWEENAQLAVERLSSEQWFRGMGFPSELGAIVTRSKDQILDAFSGKDVEAETAIGLGALIGIGGGAIVTKIFGGQELFTGERKQKKEDTQKAIDTYELMRKKMFSFLDMYKKDENGKLIKENGKYVIDPPAAEAVLRSLYNNLDFQSQIDEMENPAVRQHMMDKMMQEYVWAAKKAGIFERAFRSFENIKNYKPEEIAELGFDPESTVDYTAFIDNLKKVGERYDEVYNNSRNKTYTERSDMIDEDNRKYWSFVRKSTMDSLKRTLASYSQEFDESLVEDLSFEDPERSRSDLQELNSLRVMLMSFEKYEDQKLKFLESDYAKKIGEFIKKEKQYLKERIDEISALYKQDIEDGKLYEEDLPDLYTYQDGTSFKFIGPAKMFFDREVDGKKLGKDIVESAFKVAEIKNSLILENYHDELMDVSNDMSLENYRSFKKYMNEEGMLIGFTLLEDRISKTKELIAELEAKEVRTQEEETQLNDNKEILVKLEEDYKKLKEKYEKKPQQEGEEIKEEEEPKEGEEQEKTEEEKAKEEEEKAKEEIEENEKIDNFIKDLDDLKDEDLDEFEDEKDQENKIQIVENLVNQLASIKNVDLASEKIIKYIIDSDSTILENNLTTILLVNEDIQLKFEKVLDTLDDISARRSRENNNEKRKEEILYAINQIESKIEDKINNLVQNGASREAAEKIAYDELSKEDKEALEILKGELSILETSSLKEDIIQPTPTEEPGEINIQEELDKLEKENTKTPAPTAPVSKVKNIDDIKNEISIIQKKLDEEDFSLSTTSIGDEGSFTRIEAVVNPVRIEYTKDEIDKVNEITRRLPTKLEGDEDINWEQRYKEKLVVFRSVLERYLNELKATLEEAPVSVVEAKIAEIEKMRQDELSTIVLEVSTEENRRPNGAIGTQGFDPTQMKNLIKFLNEKLSLNIDEKLFEGEKLKPLIDFIKDNEELVEKIKQYVKTNPIEVSTMPDGSLSFRDGNHRANLLNLIGSDILPTIEVGQRSKIDEINARYDKLAALEKAKLTISSEKKFEDFKRGDYFTFQLDEYQVEAVNRDQKTGEPISIEARDQNTGDLTTITKEDYEDEVGTIEEQTVPGERFGDFIVRQREDGKWGIFNLKGESLGFSFNTREEAIDNISRAEELNNYYDEILYYNLKEIKEDPSALERIARESNGIISKDGGFEFDPNSNLPEITRSKYHPDIISLANKAFPKYYKIVKEYTDELLKGPKDPISDQDYKEFTTTGLVSQEILSSIAKKDIENPDSLSEREKFILSAKSDEIKAIKDAILKTNEVPRVIPIQNTNGEYSSEGNFVDQHSDSRKSDGMFTFVSLSPNEVMMEGNKPVIKDGVIQTEAGTGTEKEKYRRYRNVINKYSDELSDLSFFSITDDGRRKFRLRLIFPNDNNSSWYIKTKDKVSILAVIVNEDGNIIKFDEQGNISESGIPLAFEFSTSEYSSQAKKSGVPYIFLSRRSIMVNDDQSVITENSSGGTPIFQEIYEKRQKEADANQVEVDFDPTGDLVKLIKSGVNVYADFDTVLNSKLSSSRINNSHGVEGSENFEKDAKTINELIEMQFLPAEIVPKIDTTSIGYYGDTGNQSIKVGAPYLVAPNSKTRIPLFGKKLKDLTIDGIRIFQSEDGKQIHPFGQVIKSIQSKENLVVDSTTTDVIYRITIDNFLQKAGKEEGSAYRSIENKTFEKLYEYLSSMFYSQDIEIIMEYQDEVIPYAIKIRDKRSNKGPFSEYRINMNDVDFSLALEEFIFNDDRFKSDEEGIGYTYSYLSFVNENFITNSLPAQVGETSNGKPIFNFVKLNRRVIFTLENSYPQIEAKLKNNTVKTKTTPKQPDPKTEEDIKNTPEKSNQSRRGFGKSTGDIKFNDC